MEIFSTKICLLSDSMREKVTSTKSLATKKEARRRMDTTNRPNIMITSAKREVIRRAVIIMMIMVTRKKMGMKSITDIKKNMARKVDLTIIRNGDIRREKVIKSFMK
jgi:regulatory protein YycH of two-component signal transduction system YycFG